MFVTKHTCKTNILITYEEIKRCEDEIESLKESIGKIPVDSKGYAIRKNDVAFLEKYFRDMEKVKAKLEESRERFKYYINLFNELAY